MIDRQHIQTYFRRIKFSRFTLPRIILARNWPWSTWYILCRIGCFTIFLITASVLALTHWDRDKMSALSQTTLSNAFSWMQMLEFRLKCHLNLFIRVQLTIFQHCRLAGAKPLSEPMVVRLPTHICVTRPQWINAVLGRPNKRMMF